ncbi:thiamine diphosphokinase [Clostridium bornimense]|uniref:Thiamine diphosphokinase n=1 Tax=Clostridium bornimense TaxID=1216932 RepID=W6RWL1_9CLOT|nr:thiamine diphosphokinase [Clostridium bornimense]CDM69071.1 thiamine diphosphokinase [Clostridium bornimense]
MRGIVILGGDAPSLKLLKKYITDDTIIIAADSGGDCLYRYNILPTYLVGDLDSISQEALEFFMEGININVYPREKDETDGHIAVELALKSNCSEIYIFGAIGERMDHVLANIGLLKIILEFGVKGYIVDENNLIFLMKESGEIEYKKDKRLSFTAFGDTVKGLSIIGAKYPLESYDLKFGDSRTVSNEFLDKNVTVKFSSGTLLVMITFDKK